MPLQRHGQNLFGVPKPPDWELQTTVDTSNSRANLRCKYFRDKTMDSQLATKADLMDMENRLIKWGIGLAFGQIAITNCCSFVDILWNGA